MTKFSSLGLSLSVIILTSIVSQDAVAQANGRNVPTGQSPSVYTQRTAPSPPSVEAPTKEQAAKIEANLAKLRPEDRQLVEAQGFCPIMLKNRLGVMGTPVKVMVNNQPVFVCCNGCRQKALANPARTLAMVEQLKAQTAEAETNASLAKLSPEDRKLAVAQGYCPVMRDNRLGVMGPPVKVMIGNEPGFLCCAGCKRKALANPEQTLASVAELKTRVAEEAARHAKTEKENTTR